MTKFTALLLSMLATIVAFVVSFAFHVNAESQLQQMNEMRLKSVLLADELRQSSNDLTRLVRTYVVTGDQTFKAQFNAVREIRDGLRPRPADYGPSFWDFYVVSGESNRRGPAIPLLEVMRRAGFTEAELGKLAEAKDNSDALTKLEYEAMALIEQQSPPTPELRERAISMLHDEAFHLAKVRIMRPIVEFDRMVNERTRAAVESARQLTLRMRIIQIGLGLLSLYLLWRVHRELHVILGCTVSDLQRTISRLGSGDFLSRIEVPVKHSNSVLAWLRDTQVRLARMELLQFRAIVTSSDDAIISKTTAGIITSWNSGAERLFGFSEAEAVGQSMTKLIIPADREEEEPRNLARITAGERVEHYETVRRRKDGLLIDVSVTISPICDDSGRVIGASTIARDITRTKEAEAQIQRLAFYDPLTELPNRRLLQERLGHALQSMRRRGETCAVLFIDLDNFKSLNDTRGHDVGDLLLQEVARRLRQCVRGEDTVARFGGDEFVVLLLDSSASGVETASHAEIVGAKILAALAQPYELNGGAHFCTPSIGVSIPTAADSTSDELLKQADLAMYQAKASGRNTIRFFDPRMQMVVDQSASADRELRVALTEHQFEVHVQPQVDALGRVRGGEVLLRWRKPGGVLVQPADFIPHAEESGLIVSIGRWVLTRACEQLAAWQAHPRLREVSLAVNVSAKQLREPEFVDMVLETLGETGADPRRLILELTESTMATHVESIIDKMNRLKVHGLRFSLDDFGTGYSSLSYLKRMPLDELKIDRDFVKDMLVDPNDAAIARMVSALASSLGIESIAEGVESPEQQIALAGMGCHAYQGFLFGRPMPIPLFEAHVLESPPDDCADCQTTTTRMQAGA